MRNVARFLLPLALLSACAAPTSEGASAVEATGATTLKAATLDEGRPVFNVECFEGETFKFKVRGSYKAEALHGEGVIDEAAAHDETSFDNGTVTLVVADDAFLQVDRPSWWASVPAVHDGPSITNTALRLTLQDNQLKATGAFRHREGTFACQLWSRPAAAGSTWTRTF